MTPPTFRALSTHTSPTGSLTPYSSSAALTTIAPLLTPSFGSLNKGVYSSLSLLLVEIAAIEYWPSQRNQNDRISGSFNGESLGNDGAMSRRHEILYTTHVPESLLYFRYLSLSYVCIAAARQMKISPLRREEWRADRPQTLQDSSSMPFFADEIHCSTSQVIGSEGNRQLDCFPGCLLPPDRELQGQLVTEKDFYGTRP
jgi:hypothetical protein